MTPGWIVAELRRRDPLLTTVGWLMIGGLAGAAALAALDTRAILGINPWIKPMKFFSSIAIFLWTMAWFMPEADPRHARRLHRIRWTIALTMVGEIALISLQSARGTTSHFNVSTAFSAIVFQAMGAMILANTLAVATFQRSLRREQPAGRAGYLRGLRLGLLIFVIGSLEGFVMIANQAHSVPRPDGGPGLPFVNWSTTGGDLRIAHFLALHALQLLPLAGFLLDRFWAARPALRARIVSLGALAWAGVAALVLWLAVMGRPLIAQ
jgi:hypothetical protein